MGYGRVVHKGHMRVGVCTVYRRYFAQYGHQSAPAPVFASGHRTETKAIVESLPVVTDNLRAVRQSGLTPLIVFELLEDNAYWGSRALQPF